MQVDAKSAGMSEERLGEVTRHLMERYIEPGKIAGALPLVFRRGSVAYFQPLGEMDMARQKPMAEDTLFRIYSMSKPVTSVALMMLYEEGRFQLQDRVSRFIPEWKDLEVYVSGIAPNFITRPVDREMRIKDLFTHMSGLTYGFQNRTNVDHAYRRMHIGGGENGATLRTMIEQLADVPLEFSPGTRWNYSVSTDVLGYLVEVISGQRFDEFLKERLFDPLRMEDTGFVVPPEKVSRFASNYARNPDKSLRVEDDAQESPYLEERAFLSGGGGLVSTAEDYLKFCRMLLSGGELDGERILGRKTIELMTENHLPNDDDLTQWAAGEYTETGNEGYGFGLGFSVYLGPARCHTIGSRGEYAWGGAASTTFWIDPAEDLIVIFMTQFMPSGTFNFRGQLKTLIYPAIVD